MIDYDPHQLPVLSKPKGLMSEMEARKVGVAATRLQTLRGLCVDCVRGGIVSVATKNGTVALNLDGNDTQAVISTLMDREAAYRIQMNIDVDDFTPAIRI